MIVIMIDARTSRSPHRVAVGDRDALFAVVFALSETGEKYKVWDGYYRSQEDFYFGDLKGWYVPQTSTSESS